MSNFIGMLLVVLSATVAYNYFRPVVDQWWKANVVDQLIKAKVSETWANRAWNGALITLAVLVAAASWAAAIGSVAGYFAAMYFYPMVMSRFSSEGSDDEQ